MNDYLLKLARNEDEKRLIARLDGGREEAERKRLAVSPEWEAEAGAGRFRIDEIMGLSCKGRYRVMVSRW